MILFSEKDKLNLSRFFKDPAHATLIVRPGGFSVEEELFLVDKLLGDKYKNNLIKAQNSEESFQQASICVPKKVARGV